MFAIVKTGGKQYKIQQDSIISVEKLDAQVGDRIELDSVMLISESGEVKSGTPFITGARVQATVLEQFRGEKIRIIKMKQRKRYRRRIGHRQYLTKIKIDNISLS